VRLDHFFSPRGARVVGGVGGGLFVSRHVRASVRAWVCVGVRECECVVVGG